jgi:copper transport protein
MHQRPAPDYLRWSALRTVVLPALVVAILALTTALSYAGLQAHAVLQRTEPPANAVLPDPPATIELWFSEPLESNYSKISLRDGSGALVTTPPAIVDAADPYHLLLEPGDLADGIYTVVWQVVSSADGHTTTGSFPFSIGVAPEPAAISAPVVAAVEERVPQTAAFVRWFNLLALTLGAGAVAFAVLVWRPAALGPLPAAERRIRGVMIAGWVLMGIASVLMLWLQIAIATQADFWLPPALDVVTDYVVETRFGSLWLWRTLLWLLMGVLLLFVRRTWAAWAALLCAVAILALTSMFSHAGAAENPIGPVFADWLHLLMAAVWIGGLAQLAVVVGSVRAGVPNPAAATGQLVARFSNVARITVLVLVISGVVALWLQVGSLDALLDTVYGRILLFKLALIVPLLAIAGVNLVITYNRLRMGQAVWIGRLRLLVGLELTLLTLVLLATGAMTAMNPARNVLVERANAVAAAEAAAEAARQAALEAERAAAAAKFSEMQMVDDLHITLEISPGWAGENDFNVTLNSMADGSVIKDASLIRLRFEHTEQDLGESELRIGPDAESNADGVYTVRGANLSVPGPWRIRMSVQRPDQFDAVVDFAPNVQMPP